MTDATMIGEPVVQVDGLSRRFRKKQALDGVSLTVPRGVVFGLVGENGAGKTTLVKHLLGTLRAQQGTVRVFGLDPCAHPVEVLSRIGYLSEDRDLPGWMRVRELMAYTQAFYPDWDPAYAEQLRARFHLDPDARIKQLSRGETAKMGLLTALAYRPPLLLLDEPSSGLDPSARRDIVGAIVRTVADEGRTVIFSSHLLEEVERVADIVAMIHEGQCVFQGPLDEIKQRHHKFTLRLPEHVSSLPDLPGVLRAEGAGREWTVVCDGTAEAVRDAAHAQNIEVLEDGTPSLEEIFLARVAPYEEAAS
ncbi:MAG: ATP-binding cassette domain-containing protein [Candidatus Hydrogenedentota bacterium]